MYLLSLVAWLTQTCMRTAHPAPASQQETLNVQQSRKSVISIAEAVLLQVSGELPEQSSRCLTLQRSHFVSYFIELSMQPIFRKAHGPMFLSTGLLVILENT